MRLLLISGVRGILKAFLTVLGLATTFPSTSIEEGPDTLGPL